jgi:hypothetical protein
VWKAIYSDTPSVYREKKKLLQRYETSPESLGSCMQVGETWLARGIGTASSTVHITA